MSYTKPFSASVRDRAANLVAISNRLPGGVPSRGGTSPSRKTSGEGSARTDESDCDCDSVFVVVAVVAVVMVSFFGASEQNGRDCPREAFGVRAKSNDTGYGYEQSTNRSK